MLFQDKYLSVPYVIVGAASEFVLDEDEEDDELEELSFVDEGVESEELSSVEEDDEELLVLESFSDDEVSSVLESSSEDELQINMILLKSELRSTIAPYLLLYCCFAFIAK